MNELDELELSYWKSYMEETGKIRRLMIRNSNKKNGDPVPEEIRSDMYSDKKLEETNVQRLKPRIGTEYQIDKI